MTNLKGPVPGECILATGDVITYTVLVLTVIRVSLHRAKLEQAKAAQFPKYPAVVVMRFATHALVKKECGSPRIELDQDRDDRHEGTEGQEAQSRKQYI